MKLVFGMVLAAAIFLAAFAAACNATTAPSASAPNATLPPDVQAQVDNMNAQGKFQSAQTIVASAGQTAAVSNALAQATHVSEQKTAAYQTDVAANKTAQANAAATADYKESVRKTEQAHAQETADSRIAVSKTEAANARMTDLAIQYAMQTAEIHRTETAEAKANATATYVAQEPTRTALAAMQTKEQAQRDFDREFEAAYRSIAIQLAPYLGAFMAILPYGLGTVLFFAALIAAYRVLDTVLARNRIAKNGDGTIVGLIAKRNGMLVIIKPGEPDEPIIKPEIKELPPDRTKQIEPPQEPQAPVTYNTLIGEFHYTSLLAFTRAIMQTGDWTQATWTAEGHNMLPRGFKLTTDAADGTEGTYSRLLRLFTDHNLIIGRRHGAKGRWNPNAPTDVDGIMAILADRLPMPAVPEEPARKRARESKLGAPVTAE